ncbi:hypothetical protein [Denitratisoma oestradiolicum]|uniref:hypothetical protein n=1 Tax=Denitratisoma oestradiolicum TaxID=311182 RepID=UPI001E5763D7|nr:hypothetical protein [Denitratisoma oestradiolicum]
MNSICRRESVPWVVPYFFAFSSTGKPTTSVLPPGEPALSALLPLPMVPNWMISSWRFGGSMV